MHVLCSDQTINMHVLCSDQTNQYNHTEDTGSMNPVRKLVTT
jgi:hypothetical protein